EIFSLSLHDALPIWRGVLLRLMPLADLFNGSLRRHTSLDLLSFAGSGCTHPWSFSRTVCACARLRGQKVGVAGCVCCPICLVIRSEEHTSELQSRFD